MISNVELLVTLCILQLLIGHSCLLRGDICFDADFVFNVSA